MTKCKLTRAVRTALYTGLAATALGLTACGGSGSSSGDGTLSLGLTDAPVDDADAVFVEFDSVTLKPSDGDPNTIELDPAQSIDLLEEQDGKTELLLENEEVPSGSYDWIRLGVNTVQGEEDSYIEINGEQYELDVPSGAQNGLKLVSGFPVVEGGELSLTIDFNLRKSVVKTVAGYKLRPALRLVNNAEVGTIAMSATENYISNTAGCADTKSQSVYVFEGSGVTPDDLDDSKPNPVTTVSLSYDSKDSTYTGKAAHLEPGTYTVAFTCTPEDDMASTHDSSNDDGLTFEDAVDREVKSGETANYDLPLNN